MYSTRAFWKKKTDWSGLSQGRNVVTSGRCVVVMSDTSGLDYPFNFPNYPRLPILPNLFKIKN